MRYSDWIQKLHVRSWTEGKFERYLNNTMVQFKGHRNHLLIGFNSQFDIKKDNAVFVPWGSEYAMERDISFLGFATHMPNWYRDGWPEEKIKELLDQGFFNQFSRIVVAGHSMGGYGALALARLIPGAEVVAFSPQTSMNRDTIDFDDRFGRSHRLDWSDPMSDAVDAVKTVPKVWLFYDPKNELDSRHAQRLTDPNTTHLLTRYAGHSSFLLLKRMGSSSAVMDEIFEGTFSRQRFLQLYRNRRYLDWFKNKLLEYFEADERANWIERTKSAHGNLIKTTEELPIDRKAQDHL